MTRPIGILSHLMRPPAAALIINVLAGAAGAGTQAAAPVLLDLKQPRADGPVNVLSVIGGGEPLEWGGTRLAGGDINGDGISDLVIAAPGGAEDWPSRRGRLYVLFGSVATPRAALDRTLRKLSTPPGAPPGYATEADSVIEGWDDFDHLGRSLAVADVDGDGFADIIAGAPRADGPRNTRSDCGEVYVIHGASTLPHVIQLASGPSSAVRINTVMGRSAGDAFGTSLDVADLNHDGVMDIVAGAPLVKGTAGAMDAINVGEVVVIGGGAAMPAIIDLASPPPGAIVCVLHGADPGDQVGSAVAAGDFDGDGVADLAIGARGGDGPRNNRIDSGEIYLVFGSKLLPRSIALGLQADAFIAPPDIGDGGGTLAFGDVNGDGRADLAIGAEEADGAANGRLDAGDVWLLLGRSHDDLESLRPPPPPGKQPSPATGAGPVLVDLASGQTPGLTTIHGRDPGDHTGVRAVIDLDRDGYADLVIGAEDSSSRRNARAGGGEVHVVPGSARLPAVLDIDDTAELTIYGAGGGHLGKAVAAVDLNGDGRPELIVSAPQDGQSLNGRIWVLGASWRDVHAAAAAHRPQGTQPQGDHPRSGHPRSDHPRSDHR